MKKAVAMSFEGTSIKVLHASIKDNELTVDRSETVSQDDLDSYLQEEKTKEFIVTCKFKAGRHGVLTVPIVKSKYQLKIIESEIRKASGIKEASFIYIPVGEQIVENKKSLEIFYYAVDKEDIRAISEIFYSNGKAIKALYPSVFSAAALLTSEETDKSYMGVFKEGNERVAFLTKNMSVYFIRDYDSFDEELGDFDIQNINMTASYCVQHMRTSPSSVLLMGNICESSDISTIPSVPLASFTKTDNVHCSRETFNEFYLPIASIHAPQSSNILSREFKTVNTLRRFMAYASMIFVTFAVFAFCLVFFELRDTSAKKELLRSMGEDKAHIEAVFSEYRERETEIGQYKRTVEFLNRTSPDIQHLLTALGNISSRDLKFESIQARLNDGTSFYVAINGTSFVDTYASLQSSLQDVIDELGKTEYLSITKKTIDFANKAFKIEMNYSPE